MIFIERSNPIWIEFTLDMIQNISMQNIKNTSLYSQDKLVYDDYFRGFEKSKHKYCGNNSCPFVPRWREGQIMYDQAWHGFGKSSMKDIKKLLSNVLMNESCISHELWARLLGGCSSPLNISLRMSQDVSGCFRIVFPYVPSCSLEFKKKHFSLFKKHF